MAIIRIHALEVAAIIGVYPYERTKRQKLLIDMVIEYDSSKAVAKDDFDEAVDYQVFVDEVRRIARRSKYYLLEKLTVVIAEEIMAHQQVRRVSACVKKPKTLRGSKGVSCEGCNAFLS